MSIDPWVDIRFLLLGENEMGEYGLGAVVARRLKDIGLFDSNEMDCCCFCSTSGSNSFLLVFF